MRRSLALWCCLLWLGLSFAQAEAAPRHLLIVVMDKVLWQDLGAEGVEAPTLWALARQSAVGAMSCRTGVGGDDGAGYLTLGAGSRASVEASPVTQKPLAGEAYDVSERVEGVSAFSAYQSYTGWTAGENRLAHLGIGDLLRTNLKPSYPLRLGLLGDTLRRSGLHVACLGNADTMHGPHREVVGLAMDGQGLVELGTVGKGLLRRTLGLPYHYTTDPLRLYAAFDQVVTKAQAVVVELGETSRAEEYMSLLPPEAGRRLQARAIAKADRLLAGLLRRLPRDEWAILVVTPSPPRPRSDAAYAALTPILLHLPQGGPALLTSPSTRRPGLVVNTDLAATVLEYFGLPVPADTVGRAMQAVPAKGEPMAMLLRDLARQDAVETTRRALFRSFATIAAIVLGLAVMLLLLGERAPSWARGGLRGLLLLCLALPSAALLVGLASPRLSSSELGTAIAALTPVLALVASLATGGRAGDAGLAGLVAGLLVLDVVTGQHMVQWSTLSYSPASGARFYGIGNEYGGALFGGTLVAMGAWLGGAAKERRGRRLLVALAGLAVAAVQGLPRLGADFGNALSEAIGFGMFATYLWRRRFAWTDFLLVGVGLALMGGLIVGVDMLLSRGGSPSHIGLLVGSVQAQGASALFDVIGRKLGMEWMLMRASTWTGVAIVGAVLLATAVVVRPPSLQAALERRPWATPALICCVAGSVAALALNDSGILTVAMALLYAAGSVAYLALGHEGGPVPASRSRLYRDA